LLLAHRFDHDLHAAKLTRQGNERYLRLMRPAYLFGRNRDLRRIFHVIFLMLPRLLMIIGAIFVFILFFCLIGVDTLSTYYAGDFGRAHLSVWRPCPA
jgi:hypothetical protein